MERLSETLALLGEARAKTDAVCVAFSGGKDSLVVLDLCSRVFARVEAFFMYLVPGLACTEEALEAARKRWHIKILQVPHWVVPRMIAGGVYCDPQSVPEIKLRDVYHLAESDTKTSIVATGAKRSDSIWRRRQLGTWSWDDVITPIVGWNKFDVLSYMKLRKIPLPDSSGRSATGVDLSTPSLLWLHDKHPADFRRVCEAFPYAEAAIYRRKFYGEIIGVPEASRRKKRQASGAAPGP